MKRRTIKTSFLFFVMLLEVSTQAQEQNLFRYFDQGAITLTERQSNLLTAIKNRPSSVEVHPVQIDHLSSFLNRQSISLNLPTLTSRTTLKYVERAEGEGIGFTWVGAMAGQQGSVLLTVTGIDVTGIIHLQSTVFAIEPLGQGLHALIHLDQSKFPSDEPAGALFNQETGCIVSDPFAEDFRGKCV